MFKGRHRGVFPSSGTEPQTDVCRGGIGHQHRDGQRADSASAFFLLDVPVRQQRDHPADTCRDGYTEALPVDGVVLAQPVPRVLPRLQCGDYGKLCGAVEPAGLDAFQDLRRVDGGLRGNLDRQISGPVGFDPAYAGPAGQQAVPGGRDIASERSSGSEAGDDNADA